MLFRRTLIGLLLTAVFLVLAFRQVDFTQVGDALRHASYWQLAPAIAIYFTAFWLRAIRWRVLLSPLGRVTVGRSYWVAAIGYAANNVLPLRLGELLRSYLLRRRPGIPATGTLATIAVERVLDGLSLLSWLAPVLLFAAHTNELSATMRVVLQGSAILFGGITLGLVGVVLMPKLALRLIGVMLRPFPARFATVLLGLAQLFIGGFTVLRSGRLLLLLIVISQAIWVGESLLYVLVANALGLHVSIWGIAAAVAASNLATSVPSSSGGLGPFELLTTQSLVLFGVLPSLAAAYAILVHATLLAPVTIVGLTLLFFEGVSLKEATRFPSMAMTPEAPAKEEAKG